MQRYHQKANLKSSHCYYQWKWNSQEMATLLNLGKATCSHSYILLQEDPHGSVKQTHAWCIWVIRKPSIRQELSKACRGKSLPFYFIDPSLRYNPSTSSEATGKVATYVCTSTYSYRSLSERRRRDSLARRISQQLVGPQGLRPHSSRIILRHSRLRTLRHSEMAIWP